MVSTLMHRYAAERTLRSNHTKRPVTRDLVRTHKRHGGLMVSALDSGANGPGSSPGRGHCCVLGQDTLLSQCLSPPRCINGYRRT